MYGQHFGRGDLGEEVTEPLTAGGEGDVFVDCLGLSLSLKRHRMKGEGQG